MSVNYEVILKSDSEQNIVGAFTIFVIALVSTIGQFSSNIQIPMYSSIASEFNVSIENIELTIVLYLLFYSFSQIVFGPLSDYFGRRWIILFGFGFFFVGSIIGAVAHNVNELFLARGIEGVGAGIGLVVGRAILGDILSGTKLLSAIAAVTALGSLLPSISPMIGAGLQSVTSWRYSMVLLAFMSIIILYVFDNLWRNTLRGMYGSWQRSTSILDSFRVYFAFFSNIRFMIAVAISSITVANLFAFFIGGPLLLIDKIGMSEFDFSIYPILSAIGYAFVGYVVSVFFKNKSPVKILLLAVFITSIPLIFMAIGAYKKSLSEPLYVSSVFLYVCGMGAILPISMSLAFDRLKLNIGVASAVIGFGQTFLSFIFGCGEYLFDRVSKFPSFPFVMFFGVFLMFVLSFILYLFNKKRGFQYERN